MPTTALYTPDDFDPSPRFRRYFWLVTPSGSLTEKGVAYMRCLAAAVASGVHEPFAAARASFLEDSL